MKIANKLEIILFKRSFFSKNKTNGKIATLKIIAKISGTINGLRI